MTLTDDAARRPKNFFERLVWLHGRKFYLAFFAGASQFAVTVAALLAIWSIYRQADGELSSEIGRLIVDVVADYLFASASLVVAYTGGNTLIERAHAKFQSSPAAATSPEPRKSGAMEVPPNA